MSALPNGRATLADARRETDKNPGLFADYRRFVADQPCGAG
jgi:hypothetical protein